MKNNLGVIDLFSGCGGSSLGFKQAGFQIKVGVDIDETASRSFRLNFPKAHVFTTDISVVSGKDLLLSGGFKSGDQVILIACPPCQGFSSARRNSERLTDPRNNLIFEFLRIVDEIRPRAFVMENVPGLATNIGKPIFDQILEKFKNLGYLTTHGIANTSDYGIPQRRKRLILIGTYNSKVSPTFPIKTNGNPEISDNLMKWVTVKDAIGNLPKIKAGERKQSDFMHTSANLSETNLKRIKLTPHNGGSRSSWPDDLILECHKKSKGHIDVYGRMSWDIPSPTITGGCVMISKGRFGHPDQDRAISLREAARLQTFPDSFKFYGSFGEIAKQIGNAVPPLLAQKTARTLVEDMLNNQIL